MDNPNRRADDKRAPGQLQWDGSSESAAPAPIQQIELPEEFKTRVRADFEALVRRNAGPLAMLDRHSKDDVFQSGQYVDRNTHAEWIGYSARAAEEFRARALLAAPASADNPSTADAAEPERMNITESKEYLITFMEQHFTDKTFHRYIRGGLDRATLAGDFAWQLARALRMILAAPVAQSTAGAAKDTPESMANSNARFAIDGAIQYGRENRNQPPSTDHWLYEYWNIGRQLNEAGRTGWDNVTPLAAPALNPSEVPANSNSVEFEGIKTAAPPQPEVPLWDENGEPWNLAAEQVEYERAQAASKEGGAS